MVAYERITAENFFPTSLDDFVRRQEVHECWRKADGEWKLLPISYVEDCGLSERQCCARSILEAVQNGALGCTGAEEINWALAKKEPCDVQLEYRL